MKNKSESWLTLKSDEDVIRVCSKGYVYNKDKGSNRLYILKKKAMEEIQEVMLMYHLSNRSTPKNDANYVVKFNNCNSKQVLYDERLFLDINDIILKSTNRKHHATDIDWVGLLSADNGDNVMKSLYDVVEEIYDDEKKDTVKIDGEIFPRSERDLTLLINTLKWFLDCVHAPEVVPMSAYKRVEVLYNYLNYINDKLPLPRNNGKEQSDEEK